MPAKRKKAPPAAAVVTPSAAETPGGETQTPGGDEETATPGGKDGAGETTPAPDVDGGDDGGSDEGESDVDEDETRDPGAASSSSTSVAVVQQSPEEMMATMMAKIVDLEQRLEGAPPARRAYGSFVWMQDREVAEACLAEDGHVRV